MVHPNSGAGSIKDDGHDDDYVYEYKDANKSITLKGKDLEATFKRATAQGRQAMWVVLFTDIGLEAEIHLRRKRTT